MDLKNEISEVLNFYTGLSYESEKNYLIGKLYISKTDFYEIKICHGTIHNIR